MTGDAEANDDAAVVAEVIGGDVEAYGAIMRRYEAKLHRYVVYLIRDPVAANDVVQETFIKAYRNLRSYKPKYKFSSWIYRIAHNEAMNAIKKEHYMVHGDTEMMASDSYDADMEGVLDREIMGRHVRGCIGRLDPKYREVIQLVYFEHMKYDEVSDVLHIPASTVGVRLSRAKSRLRVMCIQKGVFR